jgi:hypothetical protein
MAGHRVVRAFLSLAGAAVGGILGHYAFGWILRQGLYAPMLPGACLGLGCGLLSRGKSITRGVLCLLAALGLGLYSRWTHDANDNTFSHFVTHFYELTPITQIMIGLGALLASWFGYTQLIGVSGDNRPRQEDNRPRQDLPSAT